MRYITGTNRHQIVLIPTCIEDYISEDNPVRVIDAFVDSLNLVELGFVQSNKSSIGRAAYSPGDLSNCIYMVIQMVFVFQES